MSFAQHMSSLPLARSLSPARIKLLQTLEAAVYDAANESVVTSDLYVRVRDEVQERLNGVNREATRTLWHALMTYRRR